MPNSRLPGWRFVVVGNPKNRRIAFFEQAVDRFGYRLPRVVAYIDILKNSMLLPEVLRAECELAEKEGSTVVLRIDSPGEDFDVERLVIARGSEAAETNLQPRRISASAALRLRPDHGRILYPGQWYAGLHNLMANFVESASQFPNVRWLNDPNEIPELFDKRQCSARLAAAGVNVPKALPNIVSFDELRDRMVALGWDRVMIKLASGSSGSGVIALHRMGDRFRAVTTMESVGAGARRRYYNNLRLRTYDRISDIRRAVDYLCGEGVHVEQWLPKATLAERQFDLRVVTIAGRASHAVVRTSTKPLTNLHLGNRRGNLDELKRLMGKAKWQAVVAVAEQAASVYPGSHCLGLDILLLPGFRRPTLLEANAFGDLLPGVLHQGMNTYEAQVAALKLK